MAPYIATAGVPNTVMSGQAYLNRLGNMSLDGSKADEYSNWRNQTGGAINWNSTELQQLIQAAKTDPKVMQGLSQWAHRTPDFAGDAMLKSLGINVPQPAAGVQQSGFAGVQTAPRSSQALSAANSSRDVAASSSGGGLLGGGQSGGLYQGVNVNQYTPNPYLAEMGDVLKTRITDNLNRNIMPGIRSNAIAAGGFGGSRQGVVEANALNDANRGISDALTGMNFQDFTNQMNRNLQQYGQNQNFYTNQRGQDLSQTALGANLFQQGNQGWLGQGQGIYGLGTTEQQAPWGIVNQGNAGLGQWSGFGSTTSANTGGGAQGVLGGALAGGQFGNLWGSPSASNNWSGVPYNANTNIPMQPGGGY